MTLWILRLASRCVESGERDGGTRYHALPEQSRKALCGATPRRRSAGWSPYAGQAVTCSRCLRIIVRRAHQALRAPRSVRRRPGTVVPLVTERATALHGHTRKERP